MKLLVTAWEILVEIMATRRDQTFREPRPLVGPFLSGTPTIVVDHAGPPGQPCGIIAAVGKDDFAALNLDRLRASSVDVSAVAVHPGAPTGNAFVRYRGDGGRSFVFNIALSASDRIAKTVATRALLARADQFHGVGTSLCSPALIQMALARVGAVKARGGTLSFDPNFRSEPLEAPEMRAALRSWHAAASSCRAGRSRSCSRGPRTRIARWPSSWCGA